MASGLAVGFGKFACEVKKDKIVNRANTLLDFVRLTAGTDPDLDFAAVRRTHLTAFRSYLDGLNASGARDRSKVMRSVMIHCVQHMLRKSGKCDHVSFIKRPYASVAGPTLRSNNKPTARKIPTTGELRKLLVATISEMSDTMTLCKAFRDPTHPANEDEKFAKTIKLARATHARFGFNIPDKDAVNALLRRAGPGLSIIRAMSAYMPTTHHIAPFAIMLMIQLRLDGSMLAELRLGKISYPERLGVKRLEVEVWRAKVKAWKTCSAALTKQWHSPANLIEFLKEWSANIRDRVNEKDADRLLLAIIMGRHRRVTDLVGGDMLSTPINYFCRDHGLTPITGSVPRKIAIDIGDLLSQGDLAIRSVLGNHSHEVDAKYYVSDEAGARMDEAFGVGLMAIGAHRREGRRMADKRTFLPQEDVMAATPGWWCSQPFDGPIPGQPRNQPCTAYGMCPTCEHGEPDFDDPVSCRRVDLLLEAILRSEPNMAPDLWEGIWKPVADELVFKYRPMFETRADVVARARDLDIGPMMEVVSAQHI
ncbi:hypothetical protein H5J25_04020 [Sphingomonas aliaeris]|uniref:Uncharacterized protein n=1 Tax=Sphingomonas aliaeris TaxID=2759526 RepID=A0A974NVZ1_9SPHN|nr:hypothetical protein [Sphingomonas aliaeris]QQV77925.1 hypothetical protein H5J25_04020 [Sphingomonas aliaeris]